LKHLWIVLLFIWSTVFAISYEQPQNFQANGIAYCWENEPNFSDTKNVFLNAFVKYYSQIPLEVLRQPSREAMIQWLDDAFDEMYADYKNSKSRLWLSAKKNDKIVGFLVIDLAKYPDEMYFAQLAIDPPYQRQGIASTMIRSLFDQFPQCGKFVVITRCANQEAKSFYKALDFTPSSYMHEGYSPELYSGFEYIR
jgi:ribosomal protein S18 acetylase RimI-like enzyme